MHLLRKKFLQQWAFATRMHPKFCASAVDRYQHWSVHFLSKYWTKLDVKIPKKEWHYPANLIINISRIVCQLIYYFLGKQMLAINLQWSAIKSKQSTDMRLNLLPLLILILLAFEAIKKYIINTIPHSLSTKKGGGVKLTGFPLTWKVRENLEKKSYGKVRKRFLFFPKSQKIFF